MRFFRRDASPAVPGPGPTASGRGTPELRGWKLTLPVAGTGGGAAQLDPARLAPPWLIRGERGELVFFAPVLGATTPHSTHPRSELVDRTTWRAGSSRHALRATVAVAAVPAGGGDVIIGQIHGAGADRSVPFVMLHHVRSALTVVVKQLRSGPTKVTHHLLDSVAPGSWFTFVLSDDGNGSLTFTATVDGRTGTAVAPLPEAFAGLEVRFQAGAYQVAPAGGGARDGAVVAFASLTR